MGTHYLSDTVPAAGDSGFARFSVVCCRLVPFFPSGTPRSASLQKHVKNCNGLIEGVEAFRRTLLHQISLHQRQGESRESGAIQIPVQTGDGREPRGAWRCLATGCL